MNDHLRAMAFNFARAVVLILLAGCTGLTAAADTSTYGLLFELELEPDSSVASGAITVTQKRKLLRQARFRAPQSRYSDFSGPGEVLRDGEHVIWRPPASGGTLRYDVAIDNQRKSGSYDARVTRHWALFRGDDVFPAAATKHVPGAVSKSTLRFKLPTGWSVVAPFRDHEDGITFDVDNPDRSFDRPIGWMVAGRLGVRRDTIADIEIAVAGPINHGIERISILALLRWTLPVLADAVPTRPAYVNVVSANDAMWRGGLSAPNSVYVHAERPLLSENATSTLLHEMIHVLIPLPTDPDNDWIDEGLAEYLTLVTLRDSGTISTERLDQSLRKFRQRGRNVSNLLTRNSSGAVTARAVSVFHELDQELQKRTSGKTDIFELARALARQTSPVGLQRLRSITADLLGGANAEALSAKRIPTGKDAR